MLPRKYGLIVVVVFLFVSKSSCFVSDDEDEEAATLELERVISTEPVFEETSVEKVGAYVTQISKKPFAASLSINSSYICSAVILNAYWLLTVASCFDTHMVKSYVIEGKTDNFTARVGSNYNHKGGILYEIKSMLNNFDYRVTALKLKKPLQFGPKVQAVSFPDSDSDPSLGYMATMIAWTPTGHIRAVNAPVIETTICDPYTNLLAGQYVCLGGVQDPNKQFCRRDNGGAVIQNNTLIALTTFSHTCAVYMKIHAFPKITKLLKWLDTVIWDEVKKPVTKPPTTTKGAPIMLRRKTTTQPSREESYQRMDIDEFNKIPTGSQPPYILPFKTVKLPLEPNVNNQVLPRMSLYESYLENKRRSVGQLMTPKAFVPRQKVFTKKPSPDAAQQMSRLVDYDYGNEKYDNYRYPRTEATTVEEMHTQKWNKLRNGVTNSYKDLNKEGKAYKKNYGNSFNPMDTKDLVQIVDYEAYE